MAILLIKIVFPLSALQGPEKLWDAFALKRQSGRERGSGGGGGEQAFDSFAKSLMLVWAP